MSAIASTPIDAEAKNAPTSGTLFFLDLDPANRTLYWTDHLMVQHYIEEKGEYK